MRLSRRTWRFAPVTSRWEQSERCPVNHSRSPSADDAGARRESSDVLTPANPWRHRFDAGRVPPGLGPHVHEGRCVAPRILGSPNKPGGSVRIVDETNEVADVVDVVADGQLTWWTTTTTTTTTRTRGTTSSTRASHGDEDDEDRVEEIADPRRQASNRRRGQRGDRRAHRRDVRRGIERQVQDVGGIVRSVFGAADVG